VLGPRLDSLIEGQRPHLPLWYPVAFGAGIGVYFLVPDEPRPWMLAALGAALAILAATALRVRPAPRFLLVLLVMAGLGFATVTWRSASVAAPVLPWQMTAAVEGRIIDLDRSVSNRPRILLDRVVIHGLEPDQTPARVRISVDETTPQDVLQPGQKVIGQARLLPPSAPSEPGGFDFRQLAWFARLGAVGYTATPMIEAEGSDHSGLHQLTFRLRMAFSAHIQERIPGQSGAFAAAILSGDRSGIDRSVEEALRVSNLYHIVSISGLHMTLLSAAIFAIIRYGLALVPWCALNWPVKKIAAAVALAGGAAYLAISGFDVPTQRAYVMTACVLVAVLLDRPALTMRAVALAALIVLAVAPESLKAAGFQMSFAATVALIATFEALRSARWWRATQTERRWRFLKPVLAATMTSLAAGTATAPIAAFHFNAMYQYGLLANLLAAPAMGIVVMPGAVLAVLVMPLGLDWLPFQVVGWGMAYVIGVAEFVAGLNGAVMAIPAGPPAVLGLLCMGGLFVVLWQGRARWLGLAPVTLAAVLWAGHDRPDILISEDGRLIGVMTPEGRALNTARGNGFAAGNWLRNDGDRADQATAHARGDMRHSRGRTEATVPGLGTIVYRGSREPDTQDLAECRSAAILVAPNWRDAPEGDCLFVGRQMLRREGALAIGITEEGLSVVGARSLNATRPWTRDPRDPAPPSRATGQAIAAERPTDASADSEAADQ
jgi:competence protein ComEC